MTWILKCLFWISLVTTLGHDYRVRGQRMNERSISVQRMQGIEKRRGSIKDKKSESVVANRAAEKFVLKIPQKCLKMGICEDVPDYPHELIDNIAARLGDTLNKYKVEEEKYMIEHYDNAEIELCSHRERILIPQAAQTKQGDWYIILNSKNNILQRYRADTCSSIGRTCGENIAIFSIGYTATCKQKYVLRKMIAIDVDKQEILYNMTFKLPTSCSCVVLHTL